MHVARLWRSQAELQSHRNWQRVFVDNIQSNVHQRRTNPAIYTSTRPVSTKVRRVSGTSRAKTDPKPYPRKIKNAVEIDRLLQLHNAINAYDIEGVAGSYGTFPDKRRLDVRTLSSIGQCIHYAVRLYNQTPSKQKQPEVIEKILDFTNQFIEDVRGNKLVAAPQAYKHILGALKEARSQDSGIRFWQWLEAQDDQYVSHDVYAAAIELLATGEMPLSDLEELFSACLARFPGAFLAYHLSPGAIVPNRDGATSVEGIPMLLLQAITTARLLRGDTRSAYMALDTALRLHPTNIPQRFFNLFMDERPSSEAFTIFAIACRSGQPVGSSLFKRYLAGLRQSINVHSLQSHVCVIRAMTASIYLYLGAGGQLKPNSVSELVIAITRLFRLPGIERLEHPDRQRAVSSALGLIKKIFESFARYGTSPHLSAFNSIIVNIGGHGRSKELADIALADMKAVGLQPNDITRRSLVAVGGLLGDTDMVQQAWRNIVHARADNGSTPDDTDFIVLMKAASSTDQMDFAQKQYQAFQPEMNKWHIENIENYLNASIVGNPENDPQDQSIELDKLLAGLQVLDSDMETINEHTQSEPDVLDFARRQPPVRLLPYPSELLLPDDELRVLYDELTTEQKKITGFEVSTSDGQNDSESQERTQLPVEEGLRKDPPPVEAREQHVSLTNIGFGALRYENWKSINYLLSLSERHDQAHGESMDHAISAGERPPRRNMHLTEEEQKELQGFGLSDFIRRERAEAAAALSQSPDVQRVKAEIVRLRGIR